MKALDNNIDVLNSARYTFAHNTDERLYVEV